MVERCNCKPRPSAKGCARCNSTSYRWPADLAVIWIKLLVHTGERCRYENIDAPEQVVLRNTIVETTF
jgi:hypothetical protein